MDEGLDYSGTTTLRLVRRSSEESWVPLFLNPELRVRSVVDGGGRAVRFVRPRESGDLWLDLGALTDTATLRIAYDGDLLDRPGNLFVVSKGYTDWYPALRFDRPARHRMTFHVPDDYRIAAVGELISEARADGFHTTVWAADNVPQVTFNLGEYDEYIDRPAEGPELAVHMSTRIHRTLTVSLDLLEQRDMADMVLRDLRESVRFFEDVYGPAPVDRLLASEIPYGHGQAFSGVILLSWSTFQWTGESGADELFRAHEVAHQWWGIGVRPASYRDQWLAEGFSEFSGLWYAARARVSLDLYLERLAESRREILRRRGKAGPIALGSRAYSSWNPEDHQNVIYGKGAWVLHMLRGLLTDLDTGDDAAFARLMRGFYGAHRGGSASTEDFAAAVSEAAGESMDWFFNQWVYGFHVPSYTFSYRFEHTADGSVRAHVRVRQENVPNGFRMLVPILLDFGGEGTSMVRILVEGPLTETVLPLLPREPDRIEFNPYEAVLAETRTEGWKNRP